MKVKGVLPHQIDFALSKDKFTLLIGGFGSGKTRAILYRYMQLSVLRKGKVKILLVSPTYRLIKDVDIPLFTEYLDDLGIPYKYNRSDYTITINDYIKGTIMFRSGDRPERLVGFECTDFIIDEFDTIPQVDKQKDVWEKCISRCRKVPDATGGVVTTPEGFRYTHHLFEELKVGRTIRANTEDNIYLPGDYIETLYDQYDEQLVEQYIHGRYVNINNMSAYYGFKREYNVIDSYIPTSNAIHCSVDFNISPFTATVGEYNAQGQMVIFKEYYIKNCNTRTFVQQLVKDFPKKTIFYYPDLSGVRRQTSAEIGVTDIRILQESGKVVGVKRSSIKDRLNRTNNALDKGWVTITKDCTYLIRDLEQVAMTPDSKIDGSNKELTHISDAFSYLCERIFMKRTK